MVSLFAQLSLADTVHLIPGSERSQMTGEIKSYNRRELVLEASGGREVSIPSDRVARIETELKPPHKLGNELLAAGDYRAALVQFGEANATEPRAWVKREIFSQIILCYLGLADYERAGDAFALLVKSEPETRFFAVMPLCWQPQRPAPALERKALAWIESEIPAVRLMGASWLLSGAHAARVTTMLEQLTSSADERIARLATAQLWRNRIVTADANEIARWEALLDQLDPALRGGPGFVVAQGWARNRQHERAALLFTRVPILYDSDPQLAATALYEAGRQLEALNRPAEAQTLYGELLERYPNGVWAQPARERLNGLK